jgi:hypothetical protein
MATRTKPFPTTSKNEELSSALLIDPEGIFRVCFPAYEDIYLQKNPAALRTMLRIQSGATH